MKLQETLEHLNFSRLEAQIYMALIGSEPMSAYQLAKKIAIARPFYLQCAGAHAG